MEVSKNVVAILLVLFIIVSVVGTWTVLSYVSSAGAVSPLAGMGPTQGHVNIFVPGESHLQGQVEVLVT